MTNRVTPMGTATSSGAATSTGLCQSQPEGTTWCKAQPPIPRQSRTGFNSLGRQCSMDPRPFGNARLHGEPKMDDVAAAVMNFKGFFGGGGYEIGPFDRELPPAGGNLSAARMRLTARS